ncbi:hypothetical protein D3C75_1054640 [compost metagenome]
MASSCISSTLAAARSTSSIRATTLAEAEPTTLRELAAWPLAASVKLAESLACWATLSAVELSSVRAVTT